MDKNDAPPNLSHCIEQEHAKWLGAVVCLCLVLLAGCGNGTGSAPTT